MAPISVVIPTFNRRSQLEATLRRILDCSPPPREVIVHVDGGDEATEPWLRSKFPDVKVIQSAERMGPGGGRSKLIAEASSDVVASFDDDSYPMDADYFARLSQVFERLPDASVVASQIIHRGEAVPDAEPIVRSSISFIGCGVAYRKTEFLACGGYVPLATAYGMEETDLAIRLVSRGKIIYFTPWLRVFHDTDLSHHASPAITAASIANLGLLAYLRYPFRYWPYGCMQVIHRVIWLLMARRLQGVVTGLASIPAHVWRYRQYRDVVNASGLAKFLRARESSDQLEPIRVELDSRLVQGDA